jgi:hypothetical protein
MFLSLCSPYHRHKAIWTHDRGLWPLKLWIKINFPSILIDSFRCFVTLMESWQIQRDLESFMDIINLIEGILGINYARSIYWYWTFKY